MVITFIGYRGCGKTTLAGPLAEELGWQSVDADTEIERRAGKSIAEIFADDGESVFRAHEREVMSDLLQQEQLVIAAGGGAILNAETRRECRQRGLVFWLQADVETLVERIYGDPTTGERRPNLTAAGGREEVKALLAEREPLYREAATHTVSVAGRSVDDILAEVLMLIHQTEGTTPQ